MNTFESDAPEGLRAQARRAYEQARLRYALGVAWLVVPMIALCLTCCAQPLACLALGVALLLTTASLRWYGREPGRAVVPGLLMGSLGFALPWLMKASGHGCGPGACGLVCVGPCVTLGLALGVLLAWRTNQRAQAHRAWSYTASLGIVAGMTAALGCLPLGLVGAMVALASTSLSSFTLATLAPEPG